MVKCESAREFISNWDSIGVGLPLLLYTNRIKPIVNSIEAVEFIHHAVHCNSCRKWLEDSIDLEARSRIDRLNKYCCPRFFAAVEEPEEDGLSVKLQHFRDERLWMIDQPQREFGFEFIVFCPWCGKKLPEEPFVDNEKTKANKALKSDS